MFPLMVFTKFERHLFKISRVTCTLIKLPISLGRSWNCNFAYRVEERTSIKDIARLSQVLIRGDGIKDRFKNVNPQYAKPKCNNIMKAQNQTN